MEETSAPATSADANPGRKRGGSVSRSMISEDSQTVLLNHPSASDTSENQQPTAETDHMDEPTRPKLQSRASTFEPKKCWICLQTEAEDTLDSSEWKSPCACRLRAHEECLLDWIAEVERPKPGQSGRSKVECPQCKTPIQVARPKSYLLEIIRKIQRIIAKLTIPATAVALVGGVTYGCYLHGLSTVYLIFGTEDANSLLSLERGVGFHSGVEFALPLIPVALLASRTSYADNVLPVLPIFYFTISQPSRTAPLWPPSAAMTIVTLPYIRAIYRGAWKYLFAEKEKAWTKELYPRNGDDEGMPTQIEPIAEEHAANGDDGVNIEVDIQLDMVDEEDEGDNAAQAEQRVEGNEQQQPPVEQADPAADEAEIPPLPNPEPEPQPQPQAVPPVNPPPAQGGNQNAAPNAANAIPIIINVFLEKILGALLFPAIATGAGFAMKLALPRTWTQPSSRGAVGFLQSRFGRSIAGGCIFVVLKDSLVLYSKYKAAQLHRQRHVVNYDHAKGKA